MKWVTEKTNPNNVRDSFKAKLKWFGGRSIGNEQIIFFVKKTKKKVIVNFVLNIVPIIFGEGNHIVLNDPKY